METDWELTTAGRNLAVEYMLCGSLATKGSMSNANLSRNRALVLAGVLTVLVAALNTTILGCATMALSIGFAVSAFVWAQREWHTVRGLSALLAVAVVLQSLHFGEELTSGFAEQFPALFGVRWDLARFVVFNLGWLIVFSLSAIGAARGKQVGYLGVLFLSMVAGIANGVGHMVLSVVLGRLFPGIVTAPFLIVVGVLILRALYRASTTRHSEAVGPPGPAA